MKIHATIRWFLRLSSVRATLSSSSSCPSSIPYDEREKEGHPSCVIVMDLVSLFSWFPLLVAQQDDIHHHVLLCQTVSWQNWEGGGSGGAGAGAKGKNQRFPNNHLNDETQTWQICIVQIFNWDEKIFLGMQKSINCALWNKLCNFCCLLWWVKWNVLAGLQCEKFLSTRPFSNSKTPRQFIVKQKCNFINESLKRISLCWKMQFSGGTPQQLIDAVLAWWLNCSNINILGCSMQCTAMHSHGAAIVEKGVMHQWVLWHCSVAAMHPWENAVCRVAGMWANDSDCAQHEKWQNVRAIQWLGERWNWEHFDMSSGSSGKKSRKNVHCSLMSSILPHINAEGWVCMVWCGLLNSNSESQFAAMLSLFWLWVSFIAQLPRTSMRFSLCKLHQALWNLKMPQCSIVSSKVCPMTFTWLLDHQVRFCLWVCSITEENFCHCSFAEEDFGESILDKTFFPWASSVIKHTWNGRWTGQKSDHRCVFLSKNTFFGESSSVVQQFCNFAPNLNCAGFFCVFGHDALRLWWHSSTPQSNIIAPLKTGQCGKFSDMVCLRPIIPMTKQMCFAQNF